MRKTILFIIIALQIFASFSVVAISKNINDEIQSNGTEYTMEIQYLYLKNNYLSFSFKHFINKDYYDKKEPDEMYYSLVTDKNGISSVKYEIGKELPLNGQYILPENYDKGCKYFINKELKNKIQNNRVSFDLFINNTMSHDYKRIFEKILPSAPEVKPPLYKVTATVIVYDGKLICTALFVNNEPIEDFLDNFLIN